MRTFPNRFFQAFISGQKLFLCGEAFLSISSHDCPKFWRQYMLILPNSFSEVCESGQKYVLCQRQRALNPHIGKVFLEFLRIIVQNFRNNRCWPFQFRPSKCPIPATRCFSAEVMQNWIGREKMRLFPATKLSCIGRGKKRFFRQHNYFASDMEELRFFW